MARRDASITMTGTTAKSHSETLWLVFLRETTQRNPTPGNRDTIHSRTFYLARILPKLLYMKNTAKLFLLPRLKYLVNILAAWDVSDRLLKMNAHIFLLKHGNMPNHYTYFQRKIRNLQGSNIKEVFLWQFCNIFTY